MKMSGSSSESQDESVVYTKGKKIKRTTKSMRLMPSEEEKKYRNKKFKNADVIADHSDKLKCTKCNTSLKSAIVEGRDVYSHPLLKVLMCKDCVEFYGSGDFSLDEDDEDKYCRWCGQGGEIYLCSKCICGFCPKCIKKHFGVEKKKEIEKDDDWTCFFCKPNWLYDLRAICALAIEASNKNKKTMKTKRESKLVAMTKKTPVTSGRPRKSLRNSSPATSASEKGNSSEPIEVDLGSSEEEEQKKPKKEAEKKQPEKEEKPEKEREKSKTPKIAFKRKRGSKPLNINGKASSAADTSSDGADTDVKASKKLKVEPKKESPKNPVASDSEGKKKKKKKAASESDSSSQSEDEGPASTISAPSKQVTKSMSKILDLLKITEMTAQLCLDVCRKRIKKFENKNLVVTNEKLIKESEKLKSVVTLLSTNLKTVDSNISSFQNKLGVDEKNEDDSQTNNEKTKLDLAFKELKRCKDLINEALEEELQCGDLMEEQSKDKDGKSRNDDNSEEEAVSERKAKKIKKEDSDADDDDSEKEVKKKGRKVKKSESSSDSDSGNAFKSGIVRNIKKVKKKGRQKGRAKKKDSDDDSDEEFLLSKDKKAKSRRSKKKSDDSDEEYTVRSTRSRRGRTDGSGEGSKMNESDASDADDKKTEGKKSEADSLDVESKKKKSAEGVDPDGNSSASDRKAEKTESDVDSPDEDLKKKNQAEKGDSDEKKREAEKCDEEPKKNQDDSDKNSDTSDKKSKKKKKLAKNLTDEDNDAEMKKKDLDDEKNDGGCISEMDVDQNESADVINDSVDLKKAILETSSDEEAAGKEKTEEDNGNVDNDESEVVNGYEAKADDEKLGEPDEGRQDDSGSETEGEKAKCDEKVTKDNIKLRDVKITLTRIEIPKDCDTISLNETKDDVYDVETEDDGDDDDDDKNVKKKVLDSSSDDEKIEKPAKEDKKRKRKKLLDSDDDEYKEESDDDKKSSSDEVKSIDLAGENSDSDDAFDSKKKKPKASKISDEDFSGSDDDKPKKWRRIKSKTAEPSETSSDSEQERTRKRSKKDKDSPTKGGRKNIKRMIKKEKLHVETKQALKNEEERKKRLKERQKEYDKLFPAEKDESGKHTRLVLDYDPETKEPTVEVHKKLIKKLKPHQIEGVKFMWDNCFESIKNLEEESGSGCILAHCMGLGKTLQVVTLVHTVMTHDLGVNTTLVVCPLNTVANWINEFEMWLGNVRTDPITLYDLIKYKKDYERTFQLNDWHKNGGVMVISYDMFRNLTKEKKVKKSKKKDQSIFEKTLLDPGPDLVICDEGHLLKNEDTALSKCMRRIATSRRIVLTGTPLQNNLIEYHCMVQFIKPNILGTKKEFMNRFVHPINNGQYEDSTDWDVKIMKRRSHVLHTMLDGCVQRFDYSVLTPFLPKKFEYVISVSLSEKQAKLYKYYLDHFSARAEGSARGARLFQDYHHLQRIWTHPRTLLAHDEKEEEKKLFRDNESEGSLKDFVVDDSEDEMSGSGSRSGSGSGSDSCREVTPEPQRKRLTRANANDEDVQREIEEIQKIKEKKWWDEIVGEQDYEDLRESYKLVLLFEILRECKKLGDKVLVFSQSLYTLDLIEYFLARVDMASKKNPDETLDGHSDSWQLGRDYFRLDGSTSSEKRHIWTKYFNKDKNTEARLFLISTKAGGLGINLTAANRVIIFDASWNPSHDVQSIFRVYRFGQGKTCYIYRFLAEATMEEKIYSRQVTKLSLAQRVVDEHQIERHYTMNTLTELYTYDPTPPEKRKTPIVPKDELFADLLKKHKNAIVGYHEHDSLLENKQEEVLTEEERKAAWEEFEKERTARPAMDVAEVQQRQMLYLQQLQQQQLLQQQMGNVRFVNPANMPGFAGVVQNNLQRIVNPMAAQGMASVQSIPGVGNNLILSTAIPSNIIQRGQLVGIKPYVGETAQSYFYRIKEEENNRLRMQQAQNLLRQLTQNQQNNPNF